MEVRSKAIPQARLNVCARILGPLALAALAACGGGSGGSEPTSSATSVPTTPVDGAASAAAAASAADASASAASAAAASAAASAADAAAHGTTAVTTPTSTNATATAAAAAESIKSGSTGSTATATAGGTVSGGSTSGSVSSGTTAAGGSTATQTQATTGTSATKTTTGNATPVAAPVVFNAPLSSAPGDVISLQGENFGSSPAVNLLDATGKKIGSLTIVSTYGTGALTARIPASATGALIVQIDNGGAQSGPIKLNAARPYHLDAMQVVGGGPFRIFGRSLMTPGSTPAVTIDGLAATVDTAKSDEHMLVVTAPSTLKPNAKTVIVVDNKNGSGPATLDRPVEALAGQGTDAFGLGVGWGDAFATLATRTINAATDSRLSKKVKCDGSTDDSSALQESIRLATSVGGAVVQLPTGTCMYTQSLGLASKVVLRGAGKAKTILRYNAAITGTHGFWAKSMDLVGLADLSVDFVKANAETSNLQGNRRIFLLNVALALNGGIQMFWQDNINFVVRGTDIVQPANDKLNGPFFMANNSGVSFVGNTITFAHGSPSMPRTSDAYLTGNRITRDVRNAMNSPSIVHSLAIDFSHRIAIVGNTFDVLGGPVTNKTRNDGETLLTEGGGGNRTESLGTATSATATTLVDSNNTINVMPFNDGTIPVNFGVAIVGGKGAGQSRRVTGYSGKTMTVDTAWDVVPDATSRYSTFVWGLEKAVIKGNTLKDNPRGIWIYQTAAREVDIVGNTILEGGGIYVRADQLTSAKLFTPIFGLRIAKNIISNTTRQWPSYLNINFTRRDGSDFGYAIINTEVRQNQITAHTPNLLMPQEIGTTSEGYEATMVGEGTAQALALNQIRLLGTVFQTNSCKNCNRLIGTGAAVYATAIDANTLSN